MEEPRRLGGRYELGGVLGRGGMAEVYLGHDIRLGRTVAVKTLRADMARDPSFQARFRREAQSAASLNHPAIVAVYDTGEDFIDGISIPYIVMEYVDGSTLRELLHSGRRLLPERALEMTAGVLQALEYSHRNGIIHRDIKPANVMLTRQGTVKVMDFGIARAMSDNGMTMTQTAAVIGTAQYLSPEQARGETVDARSDLYSTGCLLYELLTERPPFVGDSPVAVAYQHVREDPLPPSSFDPEVSPTIDAIVLKSLAKHPDNRYQSADEMRADLERALHGVPVTAPTVMAPVEAATQYLPSTSAGTQMLPQTQASGTGAGRPQLPPADDPYDDEPPHRSRGWAWALLAVACVAVLVAAFFVGKTLLGKDGSNDLKTVPSLVGQTVNEAQQQLANVNLVLKEGPQQTCDQDQGKICSQLPPAEQHVKKDTVVTVTVSSGRPQVQIPSGLVGSSESDATAKLEALGLKVTPDRKTSYSCKEDTVCSVSPDEGTSVEPNSAVTLRINSGKPTHTMTDFTGKNYAQAYNQLIGWNLNVERTDRADNAPEGTVIGQSVKAGDTVPEGNTVTLTVSTGPEMPTSPPPPTDTQTPPPDTSEPPSTTPGDGGDTGNGNGNGGGGPGGGDGQLPDFLRHPNPTP